MLTVIMKTDESSRVIFDVDGNEFDVEHDANLFAAAEDMYNYILKVRKVLAMSPTPGAKDLETEADRITKFVNSTFSDQFKDMQQKLKTLTNLAQEDGVSDELRKAIIGIVGEE